MDALYRLLKDCTVRINTTGLLGTGFFVAPGFILTCSHLIKNSRAESIEVNWKDKIYPITRIEDAVEPDLSLLQIEDRSHPCVLLSEIVDPFDDLYTYGYPPDPIGSNSALCKCEGLSDDGEYLSIVSESIRPGLSGSPLLNTRTYQVCGIIKSELKVRLQNNILRGFGGKAIPTSIIFQKWPRLKEMNRKFHIQDKHWGNNSPVSVPINIEDYPPKMRLREIMHRDADHSLLKNPNQLGYESTTTLAIELSTGIVLIILIELISFLSFKNYFNLPFRVST